MPLRQVDSLWAKGDFAIAAVAAAAGASVWTDVIQIVETIYSIGLAIGGAVLLYYRIRRNIYAWRNRKKPPEDA